MTICSLTLIGLLSFSLPTAETDTVWSGILSSYPQFLINELWSHPDQNRITVTGCITRETQEDDATPWTWVDIHLTAEGAVLEVDTLAESTPRETVLGASLSREMQRYSTVTRSTSTDPEGLTISLYDLTTDSLVESMTLPGKDGPWILESHQLTKTVVSSPEETIVIFWDAMGIEAVMMPQVEFIQVPVQGCQAGIMTGPSMGCREVSLDEFLEIPDFTGRMPGNGLAPRHIVTGAAAYHDLSINPVVLCFDEDGTPVWKIALDEVDWGFAETFHPVYYKGEWQFITAGTLVMESILNPGVFLSVMDDNGAVIQSWETRNGVFIERMEVVYDTVILSLIEDISGNYSGLHMRNLQVFTLDDPPDFLQPYTPKK